MLVLLLQECIACYIRCKDSLVGDLDRIGIRVLVITYIHLNVCSFVTISAPLTGAL